MARRLDGVDDILTQAVAMSSFLSATTGTVACWYRPAGSPIVSTPVYTTDPIWVTSGNDFGVFRGDIGAGDQVHAYNWDGNADKVSAACTAGTWNHWIWRHAGGELSLVKDGVFVGAVPSGNSTGITNSLRLGNTSGSGFLEGDIAELAFWNVDLGSSECLALGRGFAPDRIRRLSLTGYWPLWGIHSPETDLSGNNRNLTLTGTTRADHPPVVPFSRRFWSTMVIEPPVAVGGILRQMMMHHGG